jgi:hypothetical protein
MNSTCIHLSAKGSHIYMYGRGEYTKNRKTNTYLIPPSNSWWINNTEFEGVKLMMSTSLKVREEICQLKL